MILDASSLEPRQRYRLLISTVTPRPIAWVSTRGTDGSHNLAPFSFFQALSGTPPYIMISVGQRKGAVKDTKRNIEETGEFVINMVSDAMAEQMNKTSGEYTADVDEFAVAHVTPVQADLVNVPRVAESPVSMEAKYVQSIALPGSEYTVILGEILRWHIADGLLAPDGLLDLTQIRPVARLARDEYTRFGEVFEMPRPPADFRG
jgi:flavin reductase (DIM6/NTAB) family NADH-FMN oxidoreductase RutF